MHYKKIYLSIILGVIASVFAPCYTSSNQVDASSNITYKKSVKMNKNATIKKVAYSRIHPHSIKGYKKLGYSHFSKSRWSGTFKVAGTKSKRVAETIAETILGFAAPTAVSIFSVSKAFQTQHPDVWPTANLRNIFAKAPAGYTVKIGEESIIKYYSDSKRKHLVKKIHRTIWI